MKKEEFKERKEKAEKANIQVFKEDLANQPETLFTDATVEWIKNQNHYNKTTRNSYQVIIFDNVLLEEVAVVFKRLNYRKALHIALNKNNRSTGRYCHVAL